jgi:hypothetical protein
LLAWFKNVLTRRDAGAMERSDQRLEMKYRDMAVGDDRDHAACERLQQFARSLSVPAPTWIL